MKTAVVLYGFLRTHEITANSLLKNIVTTNNADLFIFAPSEVGTMHMSNNKLNNNDFVTNNIITENELKKIYGVSLKSVKLWDYDISKFENQTRDRDIPIIANISPERVYSMFYHISKSLEVLQEYEEKNKIKYDTIILTRPDIAFYEKISVSNMDLSKIQTSKRGGYVTDMGSITDDSALVFPFKNVFTGEMIEYGKNWIVDQIFIGNRDDIIKFSEIYGILDKLMDDGIPCNPETIFFYFIKIRQNMDYSDNGNEWKFELFRNNAKTITSLYDYTSLKAFKSPFFSKQSEDFTKVPFEPQILFDKNKIKTINSNEISVVVQGFVYAKKTNKLLKSIRRHLPKAEIILSCYKNSNVVDLDYDILIQNDDPGGVSFISDNNSKLNNMNRMILTSNAGCVKSSRKYILKLRSDMFIKNSKFLQYFSKYPIRDKNMALFKQRVLCDTCFTLKYEQEHKNSNFYRPFHVSDWWYFGLADDIKMIFDVPLVEEPYFSRYFERNIAPNGFPTFTLNLWKMSPEQYLFLKLAKKLFPKLNFEHFYDYNKQNIYLSERLMVNNYLPLPCNRSGIILKKYNLFHHVYKWMCFNGLVFPNVWMNDYKKYCDNNFCYRNTSMKVQIKYTTRINEDLHIIKGNVKHISLKAILKIFISIIRIIISIIFLVFAKVLSI